MTLELARIRLRGWYAIIAGALIFCLPLYESFVLAPLGYIDAVRAVSPKAGFGSLVQWTATYPGPAFGFRVLQLVPFLLAIPLPRALRRVLPRPERRGAAVMAWSGQIGFACFALALLIGLFASNATAASGDAAAFANSYAVQTIIARIVGGVLVALSILLVNLGIARTKALPDWLGFLGLLTGAVLTATAVQFIAGPAQVETPLSPWSFVLLAVWLLAVGILLVRLPALPQSAGTPSPSPSPSPSAATPDNTATGVAQGHPEAGQ